MEQQLKQLNEIQNKITKIVELHRKNIVDLYNWKQIKGYDYSVSNRGEIRNDKTRKILKGRKNGSGYFSVVLCTNGKMKEFKIHRLVANAFIKNPYSKICVDHIDNNKINNNVDNLRYATYQENNRNRSISTKNNSTVKGVFFTKSIRKWRAQITINKKKNI